MTSPLLTLIVPTYNRKNSLSLLLETLREETAGIDGLVAVLVSDNASTDGTEEVTAALQARWPQLLVQRQPTNLGADGNFASCVERVASRYFWIIGDDDLPKRGVVAKIVRLLQAENPAVVYMQSEWVNPVTGPDQGTKVDDLRVEMMDSLAFAQRVHIWFTFISGLVVDRALLMNEEGAVSVRRFHGSTLIQLGWTLPFLKFGTRFAWVDNTCVLATKDNSGGYGLFTVFGVNFPRIVHELFGRDSAVGRALIGGALGQYLPGLIWWSRTTAGARHDAENPWPAMREQLGNRFLFWALLVPMGRLPLWLAQPFRLFWRIGNVVRRTHARLRPR